MRDVRCIPVTNVHTIGRCKNRSVMCQTRAVGFAWPKSLMRLSEARCPRCGAPLAQTTRDYLPGFVLIEPHSVVAMLDKAIDHAQETVDRLVVLALAWEADDVVSADAREYNASTCRRQAEQLRARLSGMRARRGRAAKAAMVASGGVGVDVQHDTTLFEVVVVETGDRAEAETAAAIVFAARTIGREARDHVATQGFDPTLRFFVDGQPTRVATLRELSR